MISLAVPVLLATLPFASASAASVPPPASAPATSSPPAAGSELRLPAPGGRFEVSTRVRQLDDRSRVDPWRGGPRQLMTTVTYPTDRSRGGPARYVTPAESEAYLDFQEEQGNPVPDDLPRDLLAHVDTGATVGDRPLRAPGGRPLVLLSPGFSLPRATLTGLATELASRGYVVVTVDHVGESTGTTLADGGLVRCVACDTDDYGAVARTRAADLSFVIDRFARLPIVDEHRIAVVGHSIGGNAATTVLRRDRRVDAAVDLDGTFFEPLRTDVDRPVLMMGTDELHRPDGDDESWPAAWRRLTGFSRWVTVAGSQHFSFTDLPALVEQAGLPSEAELGGARGSALTRAYVRAFLGRSLRLGAAPLLDGPRAANPEVSFHDPGSRR